MSIIIDMKSEQIKIINRFKAKDIQVFAFNPEDRSMIEKNLDDAPLNCLFYPNPSLMHRMHTWKKELK